MRQSTTGEGRPPHRDHSAHATRGYALAAVLLLAICGLLCLLRASQEGTFWVDEIYSVMLTRSPGTTLVRLTGCDTNPPAFYLALKAWLHTVHEIVPAPGIFSARAMTFAIWLVFILGSALALARLYKLQAALVMLTAVGCSAYAALYATDLRPYSLAAPTIFGVFLLLLVIDQSSLRPASAGRTIRVGSLWLATSVLGALALYTNLLSAVLLIFVGLAWAGTRNGGWSRRWRSLVHVALALGTSGLLFLPWCGQIAQQVAYLNASQPTWMTPPTVGNLLAVFWFWFPFGRIGYPGNTPLPAFLEILGFASLLPLGLLGALTWQERKHLAGRIKRPHVTVATESPAARLIRDASAALAATVLFVLALWALRRAGIAYTFHAPRHPALAADLWAFGLGAIAIVCVKRMRLRSSFAWLVLLPWLAASFSGQVLLLERGFSGGLKGALERASDLLPPAAGKVFATPADLIPFFRDSLSQFRVLSAKAMGCEARTGERLTVIDLNSWKSLDRGGELGVLDFIQTSRATKLLGHRTFTSAEGGFQIFKIEVLREAELLKRCEADWRTPTDVSLGAASSRALPGAQIDPCHWSYLEFDRNGVPYRWATTGTTPVRFDRPLTAGKYRFHLAGFGHAGSAEVTLHLLGSDLRARVKERNGQIAVDAPITLLRNLRRPVLVVDTPTWVPASVGASRDQRTLSFALSNAWFQKSAPK